MGIISGSVLFGIIDETLKIHNIIGVAAALEIGLDIIYGFILGGLSFLVARSVVVGSVHETT